MASVIRAAGFPPQNRIFHARFDDESLKSQTFLLFENSSKKPALFRIANSPQLRPQLQLPKRNNRKDHQIEIVEANLITALIGHLLTR